MTISSLHDLLNAGSASVLGITRLHIDRIRTVNPIINCITFLSPAALATASSLDAQLDAGTISTSSHPLLGVPVLLKDNFDVAGSPTTAGCLALASNFAAEDAPVVASLRNAGAIILGKTNMHELALEGLSVSSLAGQTRNPYDLSRTPGGSSGGSGAAVAAGLCILATGTDTVNSLRSPASACGVVGLRTTRGLVSTDGVQPVSWTQDVVGIIARTVEDVATALHGINEPALHRSPHPATVSRRSSNLSGIRIGLLEGLMPRSPASPESLPVIKAMQSTMSALRHAGADIISITDATYSAEHLLHNLDTQRHEFRTAMDTYLQQRRTPMTTASPATLHDLYTKGTNHLVIPAQYEYIASALSPAFGPSSAAYHAILTRITALKAHLRLTFAQHGLEAALYPQQKNLAVPIGSPSQAGRNGILAAVTGSPSICLPTLSCDAQLPIGMELLGVPGGDEALLQLARAAEGAVVEARVGTRRVPSLVAAGASGVVLRGRERDVEVLRGEMERHVRAVKPQPRSIHAAYPAGRLS